MIYFSSVSVSKFESVKSPGKPLGIIQMYCFLM